MGDPYVVTLAVGDDVQARWDAERERWFPPGRTQVGAHVTLFHAIPGSIDPRPALTSAHGPAGLRGDGRRTSSRSAGASPTGWMLRSWRWCTLHCGRAGSST